MSIPAILQQPATRKEPEPPTIESNSKVMEILQDLTGFKAVQFPVGKDPQGNTLYSPGYVVSATGDFPEIYFDNEYQQRCCVPKQRVTDRLPQPAAAAKPSK